MDAQKREAMIAVCYGTRPEYVKLKPVMDVMRLEGFPFVSVFTRQHPPEFVLYDGHEPDVILNSGNDLNSTIAGILQYTGLLKSPVLVQGDTASAFACALSAFNRKCRIYHLEAGLRSYNLAHPYPEEGYRRMITQIAQVHLAPTRMAAQNLANEGITRNVHIVGNTGLDNLLPMVENNMPEPGNTILITLHRRENHPIMLSWYMAISDLAEAYPELHFKLCLHPNPEVRKHIGIIGKKVEVVEPIRPDEMQYVLAAARLIITDSGGLQEEGAFLGKKVIVCRKVTERPEGLRTGHLVMCQYPQDLAQVFADTLKAGAVTAPCPYGDGRSALRVYDIIRQIEA